MLAFVMRSDEGLTVEMSAFESLYGGQITLSNSVDKINNFPYDIFIISLLWPNYLVYAVDNTKH